MAFYGVYVETIEVYKVKTFNLIYQSLEYDQSNNIISNFLINLI